MEDSNSGNSFESGRNPFQRAQMLSERKAVKDELPFDFNTALDQRKPALAQTTEQVVGQPQGDGFGEVLSAMKLNPSAITYDDAGRAALIEQLKQAFGADFRQRSDVRDLLLAFEGLANRNKSADDIKANNKIAGRTLNALLGGIV